MRQDRPATAPDYHQDFFAWTQHQARLLRTLTLRRADLPPDLDIEQVAEEVEDLGKAELNSAKSLIRQILVHLIKAVCDPQAEAIGHWRTEATAFHLDLLDRYVPSMRRLIHMQKLWEGAVKLADNALREHGVALPPDLPAQCPYPLADIVAEDFSFDDAVERLRAARSAA
jgi:hypothetical protein